jgi:two-component sensor histidine kinase
VDSRDLLEGLADDLRAALLPESGIALTVSAEAHALPVAVAGDLGLVVNEFVTNALKYAFPRGQGGIVRVRFAKEGERFQLVVSDNGVGLGQAGLTAVEGGSGMRLVRALAAQLGGRIDLHVGEVGGTQCCLGFPVVPGRAMPVADAPAAPMLPKRRSAAR